MNRLPTWLFWTYTTAMTALAVVVGVLLAGWLT